MRSAIVALNPYSGQSPGFQNLCGQLKYLQNCQTLSSVEIFTMIHPNFFPLSAVDYNIKIDSLKRNIKESIEQNLNRQFDYTNLEVRETYTSNNDELVQALCELTRERSADVLIMGLDRSESSHKNYGSLSQIATMSSTCPVLLLNIRHEILPVPQNPTVLVAIDTLAPPSTAALDEIHHLLKSWCPQLRLVHVQRKKSLFSRSAGLHQDVGTIQKKLQEMETLFKLRGFKCDSHVISEKNSVAETLSECADSPEVILTLLSSPIRNFFYRVLRGSTAQHLMNHHTKPLLVLRKS